MRGISSKAKAYQRRQQRRKALCVQAGFEWPLRLVFVTGAGISAASGIPTFRGPNGLWKQAELQRFSHSSILKTDLAGFLEFQNARRQQILASEPTLAHRLIASLQDRAQVSVITQNIDDLHERAGSQDVWHLHGSIQHTVPIGFRGDKYRKAWQGDIQLGDRCPITRSQLRPDIVLFGERLYDYYPPRKWLCEADMVVVIGTSLQVEPAASLLRYINPAARVFYINPDSNALSSLPFPGNPMCLCADDGMTEINALINSVIKHRNIAPILFCSFIFIISSPIRMVLDMCRIGVLDLLT